MKKFTPLNKSDIIVVTDYNEDTIVKLQGYALVIYIDQLSDIEKIRKVVQPPSKIHCVVYEAPNRTLSSININNDWKDIPIHLYLSGIGDFSKISYQIPILRELDIRIFFYASNSSAITDTQILSSLGIYSGLRLFNHQELWDEINDLLHYSIYGKVNHTAIEPFDFLCRNYNEEQFLNINNVYFNNPLRFIHINSKEEIFLTREDLCENTNLVETGIENIRLIFGSSIFKKSQITWQEHFLKEEGCAYCPAWRICEAYFEKSEGKEKCREVMSDLLEAIEFYKSHNQKKHEKQICLP